MGNKFIWNPLDNGKCYVFQFAMQLMENITAMGLFKEKNENYELWEHLDIDIDECYLAGDCLYSTMLNGIQGNAPIYEITDDKTKDKIKNLFNRNFDE